MTGKIRRATVDQTSAPLAREFATRPLSDEFWAGEVDDISRSYRDLPVLDQGVVWLWEELGAHCRATAAMLRESFEITVYDDLDPYVTSEEMLADIDRGVYKVTSLHSHHPVWDIPTNVAFRITHDITGHGLTGSDFSFKGEVTAYRNQCMSTPEHLWPVLFTEVVAQSAYCNVHHLFGEQKVALIPLTQAEIDEHVGKIMDAPDAAYDATHRSASQQQWNEVAASIRARQAAIGDKPVLHLLPDDDVEAVEMLREHHGLPPRNAFSPPSDRFFGEKGIEEIVHEKGFSLNSYGSAPTGGYMVSTAKGSEEVFPLSTIQPEDIASYRQRHAAQLADPNTYLGAWVHNGQVYLDLSTHVQSKDEAITLAHAHDQLGIYDLGSGQTIDTPAMSAAASKRVFAARTCDSCGSRMAPFLPRKRLDSGDLVCRSCEQRSQSPQTPQTEPFQPTASFRVSVLDQGEQVPITVWAGGDAVEAISKAREEQQDPGSVHVAVEQRGDKGWTPIWAEGLRTVAHDSGDGVTIRHCPFCGGGSPIARSDGTAQCQFCDTCFTVQVQPAHSATPQTINGVPHVHPDMPGTSPDQPPAQQTPQPAPAVPGGTQPGDPTSAPANAPQKAPDKPKHLPPWLQDKKSSRYYLTAKGALSEESYLRHLALRYAEDRSQVLSVLRADQDQR